MRCVLIAFLCISSAGFTQDCDTLYSHEKYVQRTVEIYHRTCNQLYIDSTYSIVQWYNVDTNYLTPKFLKSSCFSLFDSKTGKLLEESWEANDTVYNKKYFSSGSLKSFSKSVYQDEPLYFHHIEKKHFESGQVFYEGEYKSLSLTKHVTYYPNGAIESSAKRFSFNPYNFGEYLEFFPNGQVSKRTVYSLPDTTSNQHQNGSVLSEEFFTEYGEPAESDQNELGVMHIPIYPPVPQNSEYFYLGENTYSYEAFNDQPGYRDDMQVFKDRIIQNLRDQEGLTCRKGVVWFWLFITEEGEIQRADADSQDKKLSAAITESIQIIGEWSVGIQEGKPVEVYVLTYLIIDL